MSFATSDVVVLVIAAAAIALVNWYFLSPKRTARAATSGTGGQDITIRIQGGYDPAIVEVEAGRPVRLTFDRREENPCSEEIVIPSFGIRRELPAFKRTTIEVTPPAPGRYEYSCGMGMLHGAIVAK